MIQMTQFFDQWCISMVFIKFQIFFEKFKFSAKIWPKNRHFCLFSRRFFETRFSQESFIEIHPDAPMNLFSGLKCSLGYWLQQYRELFWILGVFSKIIGIFWTLWVIFWRFFAKIGKNRKKMTPQGPENAHYLRKNTQYQKKLSILL